MARVFVVRTQDDGVPVPGVFQRLLDGEARIGWSYQDDLDLRLIDNLCRESMALSEAQGKATRCLPFLRRVSVGDYLLYPHQPQYGVFAIVRVIGDYGYSSKSIEGDFRSFRPCLLETEQPIDWNDDIVPLRLKNLMGLPGRLYELLETAAVEEVLRRKSEAAQIAPGNLKKGIQLVQAAAGPLLAGFNASVSALIHNEFRKQNFSLLWQDLFTRMGLQSQYQEGAGEYGSDIVLTLQHDVLPVEIRIGIQAFSYEGDVVLQKFKRKLDQLVAGWENNSLDYGLLVTPVVCSSTCRETLKQHNREHPTRLIKLIDGSYLAQLFIQHFRFLLRTATQLRPSSQKD
jgi:hypothetical protein